MTVRTPSATYQAKWEAPLLHLKPRESSLSSCSSGSSSNTPSSSFIFDQLKGAILPSAFLSEKTKNIYKQKFDAFWKETNPSPLRDRFKLTAHEISTPDGCKLNALLYLHAEADSKTPTVIYFQANGCIASEDSQRWLLQKSIDANQPFNFVAFDYRSSGDSKGDFKSPKDLQLDGASIVQWVRSELKTPDDRIYFYGRSLGGAIAAQTKALYVSQLTGPIVSERSFSSLSNVAHEHVKQIDSIWKRCLSRFLLMFAKCANCEIDAVEAFKKLKGKKLVVYHPDDPVIPYGASLQNHLDGTPHEALCLKSDILDKDDDLHNLPLCFYKDAETEIARFLFK